MKKLFLLLAGGLAAFGANAQYAHPNSVAPAGSSRKVASLPAEHPAVAAGHSTDRTTSTACFITESFAGGTYNTLPTGWTAGTFSGPGTWHWSDTLSRSSYEIGTIHSTTASDGWMIFDSDSLGGAGSTLPSSTPSGWLQSPVYNCFAETSVRLTFEDYFRRFQDSCFVWVTHVYPATWAAGTYSVYPVYANNSISTNSSTANPTTVHINISGQAAGFSNVTIRFVYDGPPDGGYAWMIDDVCLSTLNADDVSIEKSFMFQSEPVSTALTGSIFNTPLAFISPTDSIYPFTKLTNEGVDAETNVPMSAQIWEGATSVYNQVSSYSALTGNTSFPSNAVDSPVAFPGFVPASVGNYTCAFSAPLETDGDLTNNYDTVTFNVTDTTWMENSGPGAGGYYEYRPAAGSTGALAYMNGARFDVPAGAVGDTVTGFGVVFGSTSVPTNSAGQVSVQLYQANNVTGAAWQFVASSVARPVVSTDITSASATSYTWAYFASDEVGAGGWGSFVLMPGNSYAAVVQISGVTTQLVVDATAAPNADPNYSGYFGQQDTSSNDGGTTFGHGTIATGNTTIPLVRMYFGTAKSSVSVPTVTFASQVGKPYPDPANTTVSIPFNLAQSADVTVTLTNMIGQVVATQQIANATNARATFNTTALASGEYIYTVSANGQRAIGQIVVAH